MRATFVLLAGAAAMGAVSAGAQPSYEDRRVEALAWPELQRFESDQAFRDYLRDVQRMQRQLDDRRAEAGVPEIVVAQADFEPGKCGADPLPPCPDEGDADAAVVVTGTRAPTPSITNNQSAGVDEGDIVKRIGDYLLVLQDGRIFAIDFRTMALTDRADVYRKDDDGKPIGADWYDEMLVQDDHILITAYSYEDDATELSVFRLDQATGRVEKRGVFLITSDDYYDIDNYATRIVGDRLVIYTPYEPEMLVSRKSIPVIRRWVSEELYEDSDDPGTRLLEARDIFRPVIGVKEPWVHTISVCPLGRIDDRGLTCDSAAFIAGESAEMFVSPDNIFLFTTAGSASDWWYRDECKELDGADAEHVAPGAIFRIPLGHGEPTLLPVRGAPFDQFSMDERNGRFRMLANWHPDDCNPNGATRDVRLVDERLASFSGTWRAPPSNRFAPIPSPGDGYLENRFIGDWLLYGTRSRWGGRPAEPDDEDAAQAADGFAVAVPIATPQAATRVKLGHEITRLEAVGDDAVVTGYRDSQGLHVSMIGLGQDATVSSSVFLPRRFESEGRSHAFNSIVGESGAGMLGVPTVYRRESSDRYPWWSDDSGLSFLQFDSAGALADLGAIAGQREGRTKSWEAEPKEAYDCEVSCIDWYGNARPIFIEDRIFALMGTELVEAKVEAGKVQPAARLDLTGPVTPH